MTSFLPDREEDVVSAVRLLLKKAKASRSIITIRQGKSEVSFVVTAITESSDDTPTRICFKGSLIT